MKIYPSLRLLWAALVVSAVTGLGSLFPENGVPGRQHPQPCGIRRGAVYSAPSFGESAVRPRLFLPAHLAVPLHRLWLARLWVRRI